MADFRSLAALLALPALVCSSLVSAQPMAERADGWVTEGGRILHAGEQRPGDYGVHPATRADWIGECNRRLMAANRDVGTGIGFDSTCRAWLDYYENIGATSRGYDFAYAIPVRVKTETRITTIMAKACDCAPAPAPYHPKVHDKRVRM